MPLAVKRFALFVACIFIVSSLPGCAGTYSQDASATSDAVYHPKLPDGINTFDAAREDLARLLENRNSSLLIEFGAKYCAQRGLQGLILSNTGRSEIKEGTVGNSETEYTWDYPPKYPFGIDVVTHTVAVQTDMLKESSWLFLSYEDLPDLPIEVRYFHGNLFVALGDQQVYLGLLDRKEAYRVADDIYFIQQHYKKKREQRIALFKSQAAKYRSLAIKPPVPEEQRKYIVQANAMARLKDYAEAIDLYLKAVDVNPVSSPGVYFSLALLNAQTQRYRSAIGYMKQYLMLAPHAKYARGAQDRIYAWEIMMKRIPQQ